MRPGLTPGIVIVWDAFRDPLRKLLDAPPLPVASAGSLLWIAAFISLAISSKNRSLSEFLRGSTKCQFALGCLLIFLSLGTISGIASSTPPIIMGLGIISYIFPVIGGTVAIREDREIEGVRRLLLCYIVVNLPFVVSGFIEMIGYHSQLIGGIQMEWYRLRSGVHIPLPSGLYRSPDILGFHVAHVAVFCVILASTTKNRSHRFTLAAITISMFVASILVARRKMIGLIAVSLIVAIGILLKQRRRRIRQRLVNLPRRFPIAVSALLLLGGVLTCWIPQVQYAASICTELPSRLITSVYRSPLETIRQNGMFGRGIGTATQGGYHLSPKVPGIWQEDGISRIIIEGGLVGGVLLVMGTAAFLVFLHPSSMCSNFKNSPQKKTDLTCGAIDDRSREIVTIVFLYGLIVGNFAALMISHQHLSGDPIGLGMIGYWAGSLLSLQLRQGMHNT